jgi:hypothetical protein
MPWDEIKPRKFPAFDKDLDGVSKQTMDDHYKLYEGNVQKTKPGADSSQAHEQVPVAS